MHSTNTGTGTATSRVGIWIVMVIVIVIVIEWIYLRGGVHAEERNRSVFAGTATPCFGV